MDREAATRAVAAFLSAIGHEPVGELAQTPELVTAAWCDELLDGHQQDAVAILQKGSIACEVASGPVTLSALAVSTMCPHHLLPAHGSADVVYLPGDSVAGFGAIAKALHARTRRLTLQETAGAEVANLLVDVLGARAAAVRLRMTHTCLALRGARQMGATVESIALAGGAQEPGAMRDLVLGALPR